MIKKTRFQRLLSWYYCQITSVPPSHPQIHINTHSYNRKNDMHVYISLCIWDNALRYFRFARCHEAQSLLNIHLTFVVTTHRFLSYLHILYHIWHIYYIIATNSTAILLVCVYKLHEHSVFRLLVFFSPSSFSI